MSTIAFRDCTINITIITSALEDLEDDFGPANVDPGEPEATALDRERFRGQRCAADQRGVPFLLTFEDWLGWWRATGKYEDYGQFVMARKGDQGAYVLGNIYCTTNWQNAREAALRGTVNAWVPSEDQIVLEIADNAEVARLLGRTVNAVKVRRQRLTSKTRWPLRMPTEERQALCLDEDDDDDWGQIQRDWRQMYEDGAVALTEDEREALFGEVY